MRRSNFIHSFVKTIFIGLFAISVFPAFADVKVSTILEEMKLLHKSCSDISPATLESGFCNRVCGKGATNALRGVSDAAAGEKVLLNCRAAHERAGGAAIGVPVSTRVENPSVLIAEAKEKASLCGRASPSTNESEFCRRQCSAIFSRGNITENTSVELAQKSMTTCRDAYAAAGFSATATPKLEQTQAEQISSMPSKAAFCKQAMAMQVCELEDLRERDGLCYSLRSCEVKCAQENVESDLDSRNKITRVNARKAIDGCYTSHKKVVSYLGSN